MPQDTTDFGDGSGPGADPLPVSFRYYFTFDNRHGDYLVGNVWACCPDCAADAAVEKMTGTGCSHIEVDPIPDAIRVNGETRLLTALERISTVSSVDPRH